MPRIWPPRLWPSKTSGRGGAGLRASGGIACTSFRAPAVTLPSAPRSGAMRGWAGRKAESLPVLEGESGGAAEAVAGRDFGHGRIARIERLARRVEAHVAHVRHGSEATKVAEGLLQRLPADAAVLRETLHLHRLAEGVDDIPVGALQEEGPPRAPSRRAHTAAPCPPPPLRRLPHPHIPP